jgi:hypothetical protein
VTVVIAHHSASPTLSIDPPWPSSTACTNSAQPTTMTIVTSSA